MKSENKKNLAEFLKEKRQSKNLSLDKLSNLTKIQVYHLEALEAGQFEKLPPLVYRAGIFKRLAKFLDVDKSEIIRMYKQVGHFCQVGKNRRAADIASKRKI